jgi:hypothetical protein
VLTTSSCRAQCVVFSAINQAESELLDELDGSIWEGLADIVSVSLLGA